MCGICGIIYRDKEKTVDENLLTRMRDALRHRGPDDAGNFIDKNVGLGSRRLSIIDVTGGHQPIHNENKTVWIVFNGEIYNYADLKDSLQKKGHIFYTRSDTEVILHLYEEYGYDCLLQLRGMFGIAVWDSLRKTLFLARDRLGIKPLYYAHKEGNLAFGSELKSILQANLISRDIDSQSLDCYFTYGYIPSPQSIFKDVRKLPPAHFLLWQDGAIQVRRYWDLDYRDKLSLSEPAICSRLEELLSEAVGSHLESEVPLGAFLSGGIDSSTVLSFMKDYSKTPIKTFSVGFDIKTHDELGYARIVSQYLGLENKEFVATAKNIDILPKLIWHLDEPFSDTSIIPTYILSKLTKDYVTVALSGDGGDEIFVGYDWAIRYNLTNYFNQFIPRLLETFLYKLVIQEKSAIQYKSGRFSALKRFIIDAGSSIEEGFLRRTTFDDKVMGNILASRRKDSASRDIQRAHFNNAKTDNIIEKMLYVDTMMYLPAVCLFKVDKMSMANSLEVRVPLLDHKLVEFAARIPFEMKLKGMKAKYILKETMAKRLPMQTLHKSKWGFSIPIDSWLRHDIFDFTQQLLLSSRTKNRGFFNPEAVKEVLAQHKSGSYNFGYVIWSLLIFELWARIYADGDGQMPDNVVLDNQP